LSTTKIAGKVAVGMFLILSIVVFGSMFYVGFCSVNTETVVLETTMEEDGGLAGEEPTYRDYPLRDSDEIIRRGDVEFVPTEDSVESIRRGDIEYTPDWMPRDPPSIRDAGREEPVYGVVAPPVL